MKPLPVEQLSFGWRSHRLALWWLGLLYRRPAEFQRVLKSLPRLKSLGTGLALYLHIVPYLVIFCVVGRFLLFGVFDLPAQNAPSEFSEALWWHVRQSAFGIAGGIGGGIGGGIALGIAFGIG